jgi:hypothetical protein
VHPQDSWERPAPTSSVTTDKNSSGSSHLPATQSQAALAPEGLPTWVTFLLERLEQVDAKLTQLLQQQTVKDCYSTHDVAKILGKAEFTVREWCRLGRINAEKRACGRGPFHEWMISHGELLRYQSHGLLPVPRTRTKL